MVRPHKKYYSQCFKQPEPIFRSFLINAGIFGNMVKIYELGGSGGRCPDKACKKESSMLRLIYSII